MSKLVAIYLLLAVAVLLVLSQSRTPAGPTSPRHRRNRRLAHLHQYATFDPLVTQLEHRAEERRLLDVDTFKRKLDDIWEKQNWSNMTDEIGILEEYFGEEGRLNLTQRLMYLFPLLDRFPQDGGISLHELEVWIQRQALDRLFYRSAQKLKLHDHDGDGGVSLREFLSYLPDEEIDWNDKNEDKPGWWKEQFSNADKDGDGSLRGSELNDFLHPEDSSNPKVQLWLLKERLREMDHNKDGKLSLQEFGGRPYEIYQHYPAFDDDDLQHHQPNAEEEFRKLDVNKDNFLTAEELKPIIHHLHPGELSQSTYYTKYLMHEADDNRDGKLTLKEMLHHQYAFYSTVFEELPDDDFDDYDQNHDELRR